ncbi:MAG: hypothetical protein LBV72_04035 [Tannerella sp.]|jgi:hypothetical protein|nr:hypothetical protein [Tannerella sp.]
MGGYLILIAFIAGVIWATIIRIKKREDSWYEVSSSVGGPCISFGFIVGLIMAVLFALLLSEENDPQATYYINGIVVKGGTNWMIVFVTFLIGGLFAGMLITWVSAIPVKIAYLVNELYLQEKKLLHSNSDSPPKIECNRVVTIFLTVFCGTFGIHWFYLRMWQFGVAQILYLPAIIFVTAKIAPFIMTWEIIFYVLCFLPSFVALLLITFKKEFSFNGRRIILK